MTCHFYNTTLIILVNGHVHLKLENLEPYFHSKIDLNLAEINHLNENTLEALGGKKVRHGIKEALHFCAIVVILRQKLW